MQQVDMFGPGVYKDGAHLRLSVLRDRVVVCQKCRLHQTRTQVVFGCGNPDHPRIAFVGEAPGEHEDRTGVPFVGRAGKLLDDMISAMGMVREDLYICNVLNCRPPGNRPPEADEISACREHLAAQLRIVGPRIIVALGASAAKTLVKSHKKIGELRGRWLEWEGIPLRATFHPAYLLRSPDKKKEAWADLQVVVQRLQAEAARDSGNGTAAQVVLPQQRPGNDK